MRCYLCGVCLLLLAMGVLLFQQDSGESQRRSTTVQRKDNIKQKFIPAKTVAFASPIKNASHVENEEFDWKSRLQFFVLGAQKAGTTSLHKYLGQHPHIVPPYPKETRCWNYRYNENDPYCKKYFATARFREKYPNYITGDFSPGYISAQHVIPRIKDTYPSARFIVSLRDPVERAFSQYKMNYRNGKVNPGDSFDSLCLSELEIFRKEGLLSHWIFPADLSNTSEGMSESKMMEMYMLAKVNSTELVRNFASPAMLKSWGKLQVDKKSKNFLRTGLYALHIRDWMTTFPKDQFLIINFHDMSRDTNGVMKRIHTHLGLPHIPLNDTKPTNTALEHSTENPEMSNQMQQILVKLFDAFDSMIAVVLEDEKWKDPWNR